MTTNYADWGPRDWTVAALIEQLKDHAPTTDPERSRLEIVAPDGRHLPITALQIHGHTLRLQVEPYDRVPDGDLKFHMTEGRSWNGNGFGTSGASWSAEIDGQVVATWNGDNKQALILGREHPMIHAQRQWRRAVELAVERKRAQQQEA